MSLNLAVLASGRGSNFEAIARAIAAKTLEARIALLISDRPDAPALQKAAELAIPAVHISYDKNNRMAFETEAAHRIEAQGCDLIVLAGFMRVLTSYFIDRFPGRILNIHPSLLPAFKGLHAQRQALEAGVDLSGCTVHVVTPEMDAGPIIAQQHVPIRPDDTEESLSARILVAEHQLYPEAIRRYALQEVTAT